jgi:hypothetical protein
MNVQSVTYALIDLENRLYLKKIGCCSVSQLLDRLAEAPVILQAITNGASGLAAQHVSSFGLKKFAFSSSKKKTVRLKIKKTAGDMPETSVQ